MQNEKKAGGGVRAIGNREADGSAEYQLVRALPEPLDTKPPTIEQLEEELGAAMDSGGTDE